MAKKRRLKRRKAPRERHPQSSTHAISSDDSNVAQSARPSIEDTRSEHAGSDGTQTSMTSIMDTDEEGPGDSPGSEDDIAHDEERDEVGSIYPVSHYPRASSPPRTARPLSGDTRMASSDMMTSTRSLWAQDLDYRELYGRRYCRDYYMPNDEVEQVRMTLCHHVFLGVLEGDITSVPLENPTHVLDVGTGTGEWAIRLAELFPNCEVVGCDISAIAETKSVPINVFFEIDDAEDWDRPPDFYDMVHFRCMEGSFRDWAFMYDSVFYSLKPGGWVEVVDFDSPGLAKFVSTFSEDSPIHAMFRDIRTGSIKSGRPRGTAHLDPRLLMDAGFVDVRSTEYTFPITAAEDSVGKFWLMSCLDLMEAMYLRLLVEQMDWDPDECKAACLTVAKELAKLAQDPVASKDLTAKMMIITGRKPLDAPLSETVRRGESRPSSSDAMDEDSSQPTERGSHQEVSAP